MKKTFAVVFCVLALYWIAASAQTQTPARVRYVSKEGGFRVEMPCTPAPPDPANAPRMPGHVQVQCDAGAFYAVVSSMPLITMETPDEELDHEVTVSVASADQGRLLKKDPVTLGKYPGRAVRTTAAGGLIAISRVYLAQDQNRLFQIVAAARDAGIPEQRITAYFDSFAIVDTPPADLKPAMVTGRLANKVNRFLPIVIDDNTVMLFTVGLDGVFAYHYRTVNVTAQELDQGKFLASMRAKAVTGDCANARARNGVLKQGITFRHIYVDRDLRQIGIVDVTDRDCGAR